MSDAVPNEDNPTPPVIAPLEEHELPEARRIVRTAFGTFLGAPDPETFWSDRDYVEGRWRAPHTAAFGASLDGHLVGSNFATKWGSVGFFGPISVRPDLQERGIAQALLAATMEQFEAWGTTPQWVVHLRAQRQTRGAVSEVRLPRAVPDRAHDLPGARERDRSPARHASVPWAPTPRPPRCAASREVTDKSLSRPRPVRGDRRGRRPGTGRHGSAGGRRRAGGVRDLPLRAAQRGRRGHMLHQVRRGARDAGGGGRTTPGCWTPARHLPFPWACRRCWPGRTWRGTRRISISWHAASAPPSRACTCTSGTIRAIAGRASTSSTTGADMTCVAGITVC